MIGNAQQINALWQHGYIHLLCLVTADQLLAIYSSNLKQEMLYRTIKKSSSSLLDSCF